MTGGEIHQMSAAIGGLQADVRSLKASIDNLNRIWGEREESATAGRRIVHDKVDSLRTDFTRLSAEVENVSSDLVEIKPAIEVFKTARERQIGAQRMGKLIWMAFIALAGIACAAIADFIRMKY
jgi:outer membrane murein-binding lipoprotein Lpp